MLQHDIVIRYTPGTRYVVGYIESEQMEDGWVTLQIAKWVEGVKALSRVTTRYPQAAFVGLVWSLQAE